jgi:hypothetical protein
MNGMKHKTIKMVLRKKLKNWLATIEDEELREEIQKNVIVTGGSIASMLLGEKPNDYDIYFKTKEVVQSVAEYYCHRFNTENKIASINRYKAEVREKVVKNIKGVDEERILIWLQSAGVIAEGQDAYAYFESQPEGDTADYAESLKEGTNDPLLFIDEDTLLESMNEELDKPEKKQYRPLFLTDNAITLANKVQLIIRFYGSPEEIHKNFDFIHATSYYDWEKDNLVVPPGAMEALLSRSLVYRGSLYPIASVFRTRKFLSRGWRITAGQLLKMIWQISEIDLKDREVLREQLIGVDQAYMSQLILALADEKHSHRIDATYIAEIIDKVFDD